MLNQVVNHKENMNLKNLNKVYIDPKKDFLVNHTIEKKLGTLSKEGSLVVMTGKYTGRSANDRYIVRSEKTKNTIWWENNLTSLSTDNFKKIKVEVENYLSKQSECYVTNRSVGANPKYNIGVRLITTHPQHALFSQHLFRDPLKEFNKSKDFIILHTPELKITKDKFGNHNDTIIATCFDTKVTIITGTLYAGEIKKSMFSVMNYILPEQGILPMHSGANIANNNVSVFFGLSGTGKTTLSTDTGTLLIGDDEHGMSDSGIFNFEGGCYAKTYMLSKEKEPEIFKATNNFGALVENVPINKETGELDFNDKSITENGRSSYPLEFISDYEKTSMGKIPSNIFLLCADAFGVIPPVAKLTKKQAMFYFVLGYTAKVAGTEIGITEPKATYSPCFGAPFMLRHPEEYAELFGKYIEKFNIKTWLINTGWTGGSYGVGKRFPLKITRNIIREIQKGNLNDVHTKVDKIFNLSLPETINNVPNEMINPIDSWKDKDKFNNKAKELAKSFCNQMKKFSSFYEKNIDGAPTYR